MSIINRATRAIIGYAVAAHVQGLRYSTKAAERLYGKAVTRTDNAVIDQSLARAMWLEARASASAARKAEAIARTQSKAVRAAAEEEAKSYGASL